MRTLTNFAIVQKRCSILINTWSISSWMSKAISLLICVIGSTICRSQLSHLTGCFCLLLCLRNTKSRYTKTNSNAIFSVCFSGFISNVLKLKYIRSLLTKIRSPGLWHCFWQNKTNDLICNYTTQRIPSITFISIFI